jgi:starvation-inducible DNA-binding protein
MMNPTKNDLPVEIRSKLCQFMNERLADLIDLQLQTKQAHWNVKGPQFIALHLLFDEIAGELPEHVDTLAERIVALGGIAEGTLAPYPLTITSGKDHVEALSSALAAAGKLMRAAIDHSDELGDADAADIFTAISRALDKNLWFVEAHLQG